MNIKFRSMGIPKNMRVVPGVAMASNDEYQITVCNDQAAALADAGIYWNHLTAKEKEAMEAFYAGLFICDDEGNPDIGYGAWFICDWLSDPEEVTFYTFHEEEEC